jgi:Methane oxygenase PmoA
MNCTLVAFARKLFARTLVIIGFLLFASTAVRAQPLRIDMTADSVHRTVTITADGAAFATFLYPDTLEKPVLYPIYAPDGQLITRGFPLAPRPGEPVDHPHHLGLWFNYENVNGLDFWNNSYAIPAAKKSQYGWIRTDSVVAGPAFNPSSGRRRPIMPLSGASNPRTELPLLKSTGTPSNPDTELPLLISDASASSSSNGLSLRYTARWTDQKGGVLLHEVTTYRFSATRQERIIDRTTVLTADVDVSFPDAKDGMLGLRVTKELQIPSTAPGEFVDNKGNITKVAAGNTPDINGNYLTSEGKTGDSAWATRGRWCMLYGKKGGDSLSIAIIDYPGNPGYPTYWHARGYGLFAANPLGQKIFSKGQQTLNFQLKKGQSATFHYRIVIAAGDHRLSADRISQLTDVSQ